MYTAQQVRSKQRFAIKRREEAIEQDEIEGGEINLIPYLDIVTNLMLFLLASVSAGVILGGTFAVFAIVGGGGSGGGSGGDLRLQSLFVRFLIVPQCEPDDPGRQHQKQYY